MRLCGLAAVDPAKSYLLQTTKHVRFGLIPLKKSELQVFNQYFQAETREVVSRRFRNLADRKEFGEFSEVLCGCCQEEFIACATRTS